MWQTIGRSIRANILIGLFLIAPLVVTFWILNFVFTHITDLLVPLHFLESKWGPLYRLAALVVLVVGLYFIGVLTRNIVGRSLYRYGDTLMGRIPIIKSIYLSIRQIGESLVTSRNTMFKQVVLVKFPRDGVYSIGFVTAQLDNMEGTLSAVPDLAGKECLAVFVPTAPNPTTGFLLLLPHADVIPTKISIADAMKMVMSAGAVTPSNQQAIRLTLLEHLEQWVKRGAASSSSEPPAS